MASESLPTMVLTLLVGEKYPSASVRGIDLSPIQPVWVPPNVSFLVDDCELDWMSDNEYDLVHFRFMIMILKKVPIVLRNAYECVAAVPSPAALTYNVENECQWDDGY